MEAPVTTRKLPGTTERRGNSTRVILYAGGHRHAYTIPTIDPREVKEFVKKKDAELDRLRSRSRAGLPGRSRFSGLLTKYEAQGMPRAASSQRTYRLCLDAYRAFFVTQRRDPYLDAIQPEDVANFLEWRRMWRRKPGQPVSDRTIQKERTVLFRVFAFAERLRWRDGNPVALAEAPRVTEREPVILSPDQFTALLTAIGTRRPMLSLYTLLLAEAGLRCESEALWLRWEDFDLDRLRINVVSGRDGHFTKSRKSRKVPMTGPLPDAIREHIRRFQQTEYHGQRSPWVFHHEITRAKHTAGNRIHTLRPSFQSAAKRAGLPSGFRQHDLRHRRATIWLREGFNNAAVQKIMGHSTGKILERYTHLVDTDLDVFLDRDRENLPKNLPIREIRLVS
jgi:integrase